MFKNSQYFNSLPVEAQNIALQKIERRLAFPNFSMDDLRKVLKVLDPPMEIRKDTTLIICEYTMDRIKNKIHKLNKDTYRKTKRFKY